MMSIYRMDRSQIYQFAELYRDEECLWNVASEEYRDRNARNEALTRIAQSMDIEGFGGREVTQKIKNLRSAYLQELKKIENGVTHGRPYKPRVPWFAILNEIFKKSAKMRNKTMEVKSELIDENSMYGSSSANNGEFSEIHEDFENEKLDFDCSSIKKPKLEYSNSTSPLLHDVGDEEERQEEDPMLGLDQTASHRETEFDVWAKSLAIQLNNMELSRALKLQLKLQTLVTEDRIAHECTGQIDENSVSFF